MTLTEDRLLAWQGPFKPCTTCDKTRSHRCRTSSGALCPPHKPRMDAVAGWHARQAEVDALNAEADRLVDRLDAAEAAREDALQDGAAWAQLLDEAKTYQAELKATIGALRADAATDAATIARLRRDVADLTALVAQMQAKIDDLEHPVPVTPVTRFGACPMKPGGTSLAAAQTVIDKWGKGAAVRQFLGGIATVAPRPADASIVHISWKEFFSSNLTPAKVSVACVNLRAGDCVEIIHESDNDGLTGTALTERIALKSFFYDTVKQVRPDLLVVNTVTGWLMDPKSGLDEDVWGAVKADVLGVDCDGVRPTKLPYTDYTAESTAALAFIERHKASGYRWFAVPEFGCPRIPAADPDGTIRAAYHAFYADLWAKSGKCLYSTLYEYDSSENYSLTTPAEIAQWKALIQ